MRATGNQINVHNGTYTVEHPERGHYTLKLWTARQGALASKRLVSLLVGPDNRSDYKPVAFWDDDNRTAHLWKRYRSGSRSPLLDGFHWNSSWNPTEKRLAMWVDLVARGASNESHGHWWGEGYGLLLESRCVVCNRKLTSPESIRSGIGPECAGK